MPEPPETERREVVETLHGEEIRDPYRWLEDDTDEVTAWVERQNEYADKFLENDARESLESRFRSLADVPNHGVVVPRSAGYFQRVERADDDRARLLVRPEIDAEPRVLVDPNEWDDASSLDWFYPSPDGSLVAYGFAEGGQEQYDVRVLDTESGDLVDELLDCGRAGPRGLAWTEDGFYYVTTGAATDGGQLDKEIRYHELGSDSDEDPLLTDDISEYAWPGLEIDDGTLVVAYQEGWTRSDVYRWDGTPAELADSDAGELVPILTDVDASFQPTLTDGTLYFLSDYDASKRRILACDVDNRNLDPEDLREVIPESDSLLEEFVVADDSLVVHRQQDAHSSLAVYDLDGTHRHDVDLVGFTGMNRGELCGHPDDPEWFFQARRFDRPPWVARGDTETGETVVVSEREAALDASGNADLVVSQKFYESADGTEIPAFVVHREDVEHDGDNPTVLYGYGGFRKSMTPEFDRFRTPFLEDGGVFVQANLRGGAEYGKEWNHDGRREHKQHTFDDFIAVAEGLVESGYTNSERLAALGRSNGGLTVGAALTQRPDLFGAVLSEVPLLDMLRFHRFLLGESWTTEYGHPEDPEAFEYIREYSPYHNVEEGVEYPAVLFGTAAGDTRVHPCHARKMTARMQEATMGDAPIVLRTENGTGHGVGKPTSMQVAEELDRWAFLYDQLGVLD
ncbi:prolyl oligopeptidase family serine peptidase [Halorussus halophilus]|uniref:prolyl oligopeptidase family serine peptidase n=1 Tax=Halorussus halophilus TaxID=2650975 RepID=UPI0013012B7A|nr:prolyl oligopeptidase family serine peptidase [Halorussus halophilus]